MTCGSLVLALPAAKRTANALLAANVAARLKQRDELPADLARAAKRSAAWISNILAGRRGATLKTLDEVAAYFNVSPADLFAEVDTAGTGHDLAGHTRDKQSPPHGGADVVVVSEARLLQRITELEAQLAGRNKLIDIIWERIARAQDALRIDREEVDPPRAPRSKSRRGH